jgi:PAS domain S-box-containing protein
MTTPEAGMDLEGSIQPGKYDPFDLLAAIIESSDDAIIGKDLDGTITSWNRGAERLYGYAESEILGQNVAVITSADRIEELADVLRSVGCGGRIEHRDTQHVHKDGSVLDVSVTISPIRDASGTVVGASAIGRDITDRLALERERFRALLSAAPDAIIGMDASGRIEIASNRVEALFGWNADELVGQQVEVLVPQSVTSAHLAHRASYVADPHPRQMGAGLQLSARRKDGTEFPAEISLNTITEETGKMIVLASVRDVSESRRIEREVKEREELFDQFARSTEVGFSLRESSQMLYMNPSFLRIFGFDRNGRTPTLLDVRATIHRDDQGAAAAASAEADLGKSSQTEMRIPQSDGTIRWFTATNDRVPVTDGGVPRVATTLTDISGRKNAETIAQNAQVEAHDARVEAERANAAKTVFLSRMSHELRTPLNAILGFGKLLEMDELSAEHRDSITHIVRAGEHLLELIDEVLDISQMEHGKMRLSLEPVLVSDVTDEAVGMINPLAGRRGIHILVDAPETFVRADRQRFKQVVVNLLANAVKYNRDGGEVRIYGEKRDTGRFRLTVSDTGIGIANTDLDRLFQPFERLSADQSHVEGTGLGLALTKQLMSAMDGEIGVSSRVGEGSSFWVELSTTDRPTDDRRKEPRIERTPLASSERKTILYVEDNLSNVRLLERIVDRFPNVDLMVTIQGRLTMEMAVEHQPDLILLDLHLPDIFGEDVLRDLRADPRTAEIPIVITSADATKDRPKQLLAQGATDYLTKPFDLSRLFGVINDVGAPRRPRSSGIEESQAKSEQIPNPSLALSVTEPIIDSIDRVSEALEFVHDLNNELGVILNCCALLAKSATDRTTTSDLGTIQVAAERAILIAEHIGALPRQDIASSRRWRQMTAG